MWYFQEPLIYENLIGNTGTPTWRHKCRRLSFSIFYYFLFPNHSSSAELWFKTMSKQFRICCRQCGQIRARFCHFGKLLQVLDDLFTVDLVFAKTLKLSMQKNHSWAIIYHFKWPNIKNLVTLAVSRKKQNVHKCHTQNKLHQDILRLPNEAFITKAKISSFFISSKTTFLLYWRSYFQR